jgi:hypothetical protein
MMFLDLFDCYDRKVSFSKRCVSLATYCLGKYISKANADDEIVDFTSMGGWYKIDTVLCEASGLDINYDEELATYWAEDLTEAAKVLKVSTSPLLRREKLTLASCIQERRPEAGEIMYKYAKKWLRIAKECFYGYDTDSSAELYDESSDSDSE